MNIFIQINDDEDEIAVALTDAPNLSHRRREAIVTALVRDTFQTLEETAEEDVHYGRSSE